MVVSTDKMIINAICPLCIKENVKQIITDQIGGKYY